MLLGTEFLPNGWFSDKTKEKVGLPINSLQHLATYTAW